MKKLQVSFILAIFHLMLFQVQAFALARNYFIAIQGNDATDGTEAHPFATIDAVLKQIENDKADTILVYFKGGEYFFTKSIVLTSKNTLGKVFIIQNYQNEKVVFSGASLLAASFFHPVKDSQILLRLTSAARSNVYEADIAAAGINFNSNPNSFGYPRFDNIPPSDFLVNDEIQIVSRWPNTGKTQIGQVLQHGTPNGSDHPTRPAIFRYNDSRAERWSVKNNIWIHGLFNTGYYPDNLMIDSINTKEKWWRCKQNAGDGVYGTVEEKDSRRKISFRGYYTYHILEELDSVNEYYLDEKTMHLYWWPDKKKQPFTCRFQTLERPFVVLMNTKNLQLIGIDFAYSRGLAIYAEGTENTTIEQCNFHHLGTVAISLGDPSLAQWEPLVYQSLTKKKNLHCKISNCTFNYIGLGGILLSGGDRQKLIPAGNVVTNCTFSHFSRWGITYYPAVTISGVGNEVSNCNISNEAVQAIVYTGNDHLIKNNFIANVATGFSDIGAIYTGKNPSATGTLIENNYFENIGSSGNAVASVYMDDGSGGIRVHDNVFYKACSSGQYIFGPIHINGGCNNEINNNLFIDCPFMVSGGVWPKENWQDLMYHNKEVLAQLTKVVDIRAPVFLKHYPYLKSFFDSTGTDIRKNSMNNSIGFMVKSLPRPSETMKVQNIWVVPDKEYFENFLNKQFAFKKEIPLDMIKDSSWYPINFKAFGKE